MEWDQWDRWIQSLSRPMFIAGLVSLGLSLSVLAYIYLAPSSVSPFVGAPPVVDRVRNVVLVWSQAPSISDDDQLEVIWAETRNSGHHDYDFIPGGVYDLDRLLTLEFSKPPQKKIPSPVKYGSTGAIKTFSQLVDAIQ
jgi:hypothetical protein